MNRQLYTPLSAATATMTMFGLLSEHFLCGSSGAECSAQKDFTLESAMPEGQIFNWQMLAGQILRQRLSVASVNERKNILTGPGLGWHLVVLVIGIKR